MKSSFLSVLILLIFVSRCATVNCADKEIFTLKDCLQETTDHNGEEHYSVSVGAVDYFLDKISKHAKEWPLKFDSDVQRKEVEHELKSIIYILETVLSNDAKNEGILWRIGFAYSMAYNLDFPGSADKCNEYFKNLLILNPEHPQGNFFYGAHLAGTVTKQKESIFYLEKALSNGYDEAIYMLGFVYLHLQDNEKAINYFQKYLDKYPKHKQTKELIKAIKEGRVKLNKEKSVKGNDSN